MPDNVINSEKVFSVFIYSFKFKCKQQFSTRREKLDGTSVVLCYYYHFSFTSLFVSNLLLCSYFIIVDVNYSWLSTKFSDGNFKTVSMVRQPKQPMREQADVRQETSALPSTCLLYTSPSPRDLSTSRMPSSA